MANEIFDVIQTLQNAGATFAIATVVETRGSVSAKTSSKAVIDSEGRVVAGWVGGGCAESSTCEQALACISQNETAMLDIDLDDEILGAGMPCGGSMRVYVEPVLPKPGLWIMGHGRVAESLCIIGDLVGLRVIVNDPAVDREKYPQASHLITDDLDYALLQPRPEDYVVIATQHKGDHESIARALASDAKYIALIASRKRSRLVLDYLKRQGFSDQDTQRVVTPSGIDLAPRSPEEIALCIISEIVMLRRGGSGRLMRDLLLEKAASEAQLKSIKRS
jgi:xanthine dehydrogenase accessory factor